MMWTLTVAPDSEAGLPLDMLLVIVPGIWAMAPLASRRVEVMTFEKCILYVCM